MIPTVDRILANSSTHSISLTLDINHELWPLAVDETFTLVLASSLTTAGSGPGANANANANAKWMQLRVRVVGGLAWMKAGGSV